MHKNSRIGRSFWLVMILSCMILMTGTAPLFAGDLDDFEDAATEDDGDEDSYDDDGSDDSSSSAMAEALALILYYSIVYGSIDSWNLASGHEMAEDFPLYGKTRRPGDTIIPYLRVDFCAQNLHPDIWNLSAMAEAGFGPLAVRVTHYDFFEEKPADALMIESVIFLGRFTVAPIFEYNLGFGAVVMRGNDTTTALAMACGLRFFVTRYVTLEFQPEFWFFGEENVTQRYEGSVLLNIRFVSLRVGYMALIAGDEVMQGWTTGVSFHI